MAIPALPSAVGDARHHTRHVLEMWRLAAMADTAELLVSELVTNAIKHATDQVDAGPSVGDAQVVHVCVSVRAETLLIEVRDTSQAQPHKRSASEVDEGGRGLLLVQALSKEWGTTMLDTGGKIVWCECLIGDQA
jgi:anti-sigma regulatory factor (Ser/Thr protein kinase)